MRSVNVSWHKSSHASCNDTYIEQRQPPVTKSRDQVDQDGDSEENEVNLVVGGIEDTSLLTISASGTEDVKTADGEKGSTKVHRQGDGDVSKEVSPATDPGEHTAVLGRRNHESLIVDTTSSREDGSNLTKRCGDCDHDGAHGHPSPDDVGGTAAVKRVDKGSGQTVRDRGQHAGHEGDLPC